MAISFTVRARSTTQALTLAAIVALAGCAESGRAPEMPPQPKRALYRGYGFWFQDLAQRFQKAVNPPGQPPRYELARLPDFDPLAVELYQQTAQMLSSVYPITELSLGTRASEMLQAVDVMVINTAWVAEFARNGWLAPFDEAVIGPTLREAGVEPIRIAGAKTGPIYGIPISRGTDLLFYRKSYFHGANEARQAWASLFQSPIPNPHSSIAADGQEFFRFFLPLVWSVEPDWPRQTNGTWVLNTPAAQQVLAALRRSTRLGGWPAAANRMGFLLDFKDRIASFTSEPRRNATGAASAWLLSGWAQRVLVTPWGPPLPLDDVGFLPVSATMNAGHSLVGGKCLVMSKQLLSDDPVARGVREVVYELARYLLSERGQRALCFDQFEIPARHGLLKSLTDTEVAAVFAARREWLDHEAYLGQVRAGSRQIDERSALWGRQTLAMLREIEGTLEDTARLRVRDNPLPTSYSTLLDGKLHEVLVPSAAGITPAAAQEMARHALEELQQRFEVERRFLAPAPARSAGP